MICRKQPLSPHNGDNGDNGDNGKGPRSGDRDSGGHFVQGNATGHRFPLGHKFGRGNPMAGKVEKLRSAILNALTPEDFMAIVKVQVRRARKGDLDAAKWLTDRALGKAAQELDLALAGGESFADVLRALAAARAEMAGAGN